MNITAPQLAAIVPCTMLTAGVWLPHLLDAMLRWGIDTPHRAAGWLAQISYESRRLASVEENLNYSPQRLMQVWPSRFPSLEEAKRFCYAPEKLANYVYSNRLGNGSFGSGDGWKYRGRGPKQITGRSNYRECGFALGLPLEDNPDLLVEPANGAQAAGWYWHSRGCNALMDRAPFEAITKAKDNDFFEQVTKKINGGLIGHEDGNDTGLDDRVELYINACRVLGVQPGG